MKTILLLQETFFGKLIGFLKKKHFFSTQTITFSSGNSTTFLLAFFILIVTSSLHIWKIASWYSQGQNGR